jgi:hypothetical protein
MKGTRSFTKTLSKTARTGCQSILEGSQADLQENSEGIVGIWEGTIMMVLARSIHICERAIEANWYQIGAWILI